MEEQIVSHYRVLVRLGGGGMGVVYQAEDTRLKRTVALKFLPPELTRDKDARERFVQEAQAASALDHPNICTIYDVDADADGRLFIVMAYYDGETLKERLARGPLPVAEALELALQIARGLDKAHQAGIVHRDIKPANVMVTRDGVLKIVDFGIAKLLDRTGPTRTGTTLGTVAYMAPEQVQGNAVDQRVDLWALGVVLYEMLTGRVPFGGDREMAILHNVLNETPAPARTINADVPVDVEQLLTRALTKDPGGRYQTAAEMIQALTACRPVPAGLVTPSAPAAATGSRRLVAVAAIVALLAGAATAAWFTRRASGAKRVQELVAEITKLADADDYIPALALVEELEPLAPADPRMAALIERISDTRDIVTDPPGTSVFIKPYDLPAEPWKPLGRTPIAHVRVARELFRWRLEKDGYDTMEFSAPFVRTFPSMAAKGRLPPNTIAIGRGPLSLTLTGYNYGNQVPAGAFLIDKFEVTNRQYKAFIDAGGYTRPEVLAREFVENGRTLNWEQAIAKFRDKTGRPGPATWDVSTYPAGQDEYPVTGVSWYEADAFARYSRRSLPTVYHWTRAAGTGQAAYITPFSNLEGKGPAPVGSYAGMSPSGAMDMAGNAKEWCANSVAGSQDHYVLGGSWQDPLHSFIFANARPPFDRSEDNGFRLATYLETPLAAALTDPIPVLKRDFNAEHAVPDQVFGAFRRLFAYDPRPLDAKVDARDESSRYWVREKVSFRAAYGEERVPAYVFLPKDVLPPYQAIVYAPTAAAVYSRDSATPVDFNAVDFLVLSGRAVIYPVYSGTYERNTGQTTVWADRSREYQDWMVRVVNDARRTMDYLESRPDLRRDAIGYLGSSWGASFAPRILAQEPRFKTAVLTDGGFVQSADILPELDIFNYVPRVTLPTLMINGNLDFTYPVETAQKPFFERLGTPRDRKRHVILVGGHFIVQQQRSQLIREVLDWLDRYLGPVKTRLATWPTG